MPPLTEGKDGRFSAFAIGEIDIHGVEGLLFKEGYVVVVGAIASGFLSESGEKFGVAIRSGNDDRLGMRDQGGKIVPDMIVDETDDSYANGF